MKNSLTILMFLFSLSTFAQQLSISQWDEEAKTNKRLLPKYGYQAKSEGEKQADQELIKSVLEKDSTNRKASDHLISLGFKYLYKDIKTAMYRFNQAYLLDSTNSDIYWGFGGVYLTLGDYARAEKQYLAGLAIDPKNTHLLTDYGTYFMAQFYELQAVEEKDALRNLDSAIVYMKRSYDLNPKDPNTTYKLSICYWNKGDCDNAWRFYDECNA